MFTTLEYVLMGWAVVATILVWKNPLPFPDRGHRLLGVTNDAARAVVLRMFRTLRLPTFTTFELFAKETRLSAQSVLMDGMTVVHALHPTLRAQMPATGISLPVSDPRRAAKFVMTDLRKAGFQAAMWEPEEDGYVENSLVIVTSDAFDGWALTLRVSQPRLFPLARRGLIRPAKMPTT
ncbi:MAG TPA: hypothetical protein VLB83_00485 [Candidatus Paceibacterota bacterium]|nr:hypothetical protein [Candidatus Paceibacterota bacterium]